ncbi:hypothetical protein KY363_07230, partial [Candidatus Woesearchaeota archaeon]|nr:hypothetical protein [Candidatus Woesearchaeota archaeon]
ENMTMNLMASHPPEDIPFTGLSLDCNRRQWLLSDVKKKLIRALEPAVSAIRFKNTNHPPFKDSDAAYAAVHTAVQNWRESQIKTNLKLPKNIPEDSYDYFQYYFQFTENDYKTFNVVSTYKGNWTMNLLATPNQYGVLKSGMQDLKSQILSYLCLNTYHFVYDLEYPIMISINDPNAFHKSGFVFRFAFPVQIFHNTPDRSLLPASILEPTEYSLDFCGYPEDDERNIIVRDSVTNAELSRVNLTFRCMTEECSLGSTRTNNRHLQWTGKFPAGCMNPLIVANKSGYLTAEKQFDGSDPFYIDMYPTQEVKFDIKRHLETAPGVARFLDPDMYAIIQLDVVDPQIIMPTVFDVFGGDEIFNRTNRFELDDATYSVNIMLIKKVGKDEDMLVGGWIGNWTVSMNDMLDAEKIVFHVPQKFPTPKTESEVVNVYPLMVNRSLYPDLVPEVVRADEYTGEESTT